MKKQKRNQFNDGPESDDAMDDSSAAGDMFRGEENEMGLAAANPAMDDTDQAELEPMDELFAEMLAHETELSSSEAASEQEASPALVEEPAGAALERAATPLDGGTTETVEEEAVLLAPETEPGFLVEDAAVEPPAAVEPEVEIFASQQGLRSENFTALLDEVIPHEGEPAIPAPIETAAEERVVPAALLAPQPPLESVAGSIDRALEAAPPVGGSAESHSQHHQKQFSQLDDYVVFSLAGGDYAVPVRDVAEIGRIPGITRVPNVPEFVRGITNLRGEVVPVLNLPILLGLQESQATARGRVLFLQARAQVSATGLLVDEVKGIQRIQSQQLEQVTGLVDDKVTSVLRGVYGRGDRLLNVLDLGQLFQLEEFRQLEIV